MGEVVGVDSVPSALEAARARASARSLRNVTFREGSPVDMTFERAFVAAGLPPPTMRLEALIGGGANSLALLQLVADLIATLLPEMERLGVMTAAEVGLETLVEWMRTEAIATSSVIFGHYQICAWSRV